MNEDTLVKDVSSAPEAKAEYTRQDLLQRGWTLGAIQKLLRGRRQKRAFQDDPNDFYWLYSLSEVHAREWSGELEAYLKAHPARGKMPRAVGSEEFKALMKKVFPIVFNYDPGLDFWPDMQREASIISNRFRRGVFDCPVGYKNVIEAFRVISQSEDKIEQLSLEREAVKRAELRARIQQDQKRAKERNRLIALLKDAAQCKGKSHSKVWSRKTAEEVLGKQTTEKKALAEARKLVNAWPWE